MATRSSLPLSGLPSTHALPAPAPPPPCSTTGDVLGYYFDPTSSPDQKLDLSAVRAGAAGFAFPHYEMA